MDHKVDQKLFIDDEKGEFSFIYSKNDKQVIDLGGKLVFMPKRARTIYELDMKVTVSNLDCCSIIQFNFINDYRLLIWTNP